MIRPQWDWAANNIRKNVPLVVGVIALVTLGVGISVTALSALGTIMQDPIPERSSSLFFPMVDPRPISEAPANSPAPALLSWVDAESLVRIGPPGKVVMTAGGRAKVGSSQSRYPEKMNLRYANAAFFGVFDVPFAKGAAWTRGDDEGRARYVVLSGEAATKLFGATTAIGKQIRLNDVSFTVLGVTKPWAPKPRFYDLSKGGFNAQDDIYLPLSTALELKMQIAANIKCWGDGWAQLGNLAAASCGWISAWAYLPTEADQRGYLSSLNAYTSTQHDIGRFELAAAANLQRLDEYLDSAGLITPEVVLQTYLALGLLVVCLINASALLLSLSLRRRKEFALRRALGAAQADIAFQALFEGALIGIVAGVCAAIVSSIGLKLLARQPTLYNTAININATVLVGAVLASVAAAVASSLFPALISARAKPINYLNAE